MDLIEWTVNYVRHRDLIRKTLQSFEIKENLIEFKFKDKKHDYLIMETLSKDTLEAKADHLTIVCLASKANLQFLIDNWKNMSKSKNFSLIFVRIETNDKMIINPYTHSLIADPDSLELGLRSMYEHAMPE